jgi:hypothetical protein
MRQLSKGALSVNRLAPYGDDGIRTSFVRGQLAQHGLWNRKRVCSSEIFAVLSDLTLGRALVETRWWDAGAPLLRQRAACAAPS